jgi:nucleotide-binding universal stress UspA family protein
MATHILVPMDYSELAKRALHYALTEFPDASVTALHVLDFRSSDPGPGGFGTANAWDDWLEGAREHADALFEEVSAIAAEYDADLTTEMVVGEDARSILDYAESHDVDLIVLGSHGRSVPAQVLLGSVAQTVIRRAPVPVLVVR